MNKYKCPFCQGYFKTSHLRLDHIQERKSRCAIAAGHYLLEALEKVRTKK